MFENFKNWNISPTFSWLLNRQRFAKKKNVSNWILIATVILQRHLLNTSKRFRVSTFDHPLLIKFPYNFRKITKIDTFLFCSTVQLARLGRNRKHHREELGSQIKVKREQTHYYYELMSYCRGELLSYELIFVHHFHA